MQGHFLFFQEFGLLLCLLVQLFLLDNHLLYFLEFLNLGLVSLNCGIVREIAISDIVCLILESVCQPDLEELGPDISLSLFHDVLVTELGLDVLDTLDIGVSYLAILVTVTLLDFLGPLDAVELQVKVQDKYRVDKVDECKPLPALRLQVLGQVEVVVLPLKLLIKELKHVWLAELNRNVPYHKSRLLLHFCVVVHL